MPLPQNLVDDISALQTANQAVSDAGDALASAQAALTSAQSAVTAAQSDVITRQAAVLTAHDTLDATVLKLIADINADYPVPPK